MTDPRLYQIAILSVLLAYGMVRLDFDISVLRVGLLLATVLGAQAIGDYVTARRLAAGSKRPEAATPEFHHGLLGLSRSSVNYRSALISGLSLCLLLRTNRPELAVLAALLTICSKFLVRFRGKHVFNPTNGGLIAMLLLTNQVWVSPGQWGAAPALGVLFACVGTVVVNRASRSDVTFAFIVFFGGLMFGRSIYLGEPMAIPVHRLESGVLLLFTFFMISDPKTTPDSRAGRVLFAALVACGAWYVQFRMFRTNGLLWSLAACSLTVPWLDWLLPGAGYAWPSRVAADRPAPAPRRDAAARAALNPSLVQRSAI